ncbi:TRAP transporter large permease [Tautonia sociabilis]|uniref:TRAP transporter large permease n=1 Tax=Tautonia sociabilis TaxID=2080755 RepID=A0A432ML45_9BACT|nr:TRAP transporter large permease [Tautonia sociabilis]RUL87856.1 TRAP transporter large permease [Tautonia sociabilis]
MDAPLLILLVFFVLLTAIDLPVAVAIALATLMATLSLADLPACYIVAQRMSIGIASFPLLAIPFFILAGELMGRGGIARRLIDFSLALIPSRRGGLAYVNTITCMLFGAISGSATAAVSSIGGIMIPEMERQGEDRRSAVALTTTAATTGLLIPPSNIMIVYAVAAGNVSVAAMFAAGLLPGLLVGGAILAVCALARRRAPLPRTTDREDDGSRFALGRIVSTGVRAAPGLSLVVLVLTGILRGWFSATEASAIAVLYAFLLAVVFYRTVRLRELPAILLRSGTMTGVVFLLIGTSQAMSWILTYENVPQSVGEAMLDASTSGIVILLMMNAILLLVGAVMDMTPAVLIFTPLFLPVAERLGVDPVHFGVMMVVNLCIGLCTPPVGTCLFVGCSVGRIGIAEAIRPMVPFLLAMLAALALITAWPAITLWLPGALGLD